ncbi:hypothetical protein N825_25410 [Skermanella stibiiresistens SB22]|uniref:Uncharacterized protein n=1 Tax=Skermanella stibiiresistens SB22 TaxID=1385369 RepID=W9GSB1_9PROT|nr:phage tail tube protein [Skermanella stibiiresistens]EWY36775.1 hypothetical protein N825_25410 [Skermanella stibiiresistens SB22]
MTFRVLSGLDCELFGRLESGAIGTPAAGDYLRLPFTSHGLSGRIGKETSDLLGQGRDPTDPDRGDETVDGDIAVPMDVRGTGFWLALLLGLPTTAASKAYGSVTFGADPRAGDTVTLDGTVFTFVSGAPATATEVQTGANLLASVTALAAAANASVVAEVAAATYTVGDGVRLDIQHDTSGASGAEYSLAASAATVSGATLTATYTHTYGSGCSASDIRRATMVIRSTPAALTWRQLGVWMTRAQLALASTGRASLTASLIAHREDEVVSAALGDVVTHAYQRFLQAQGSLLVDGQQVAEITASSMVYDNSLSGVRSLGYGGRIADIDVATAKLDGTITARFGSGTLKSRAESDTPVDLLYRWQPSPGAALSIAYPRVWLPKPQRSISGPAGVEASYAWMAAKRQAAGAVTTAAAMTAVLTNDVASYAP